MQKNQSTRVSPFPFDFSYSIRKAFEREEEVIHLLQKKSLVNDDTEVFKALTQLILNTQAPDFLLSAVLHFIFQVNRLRNSPLHFNDFEYYLNHASELTHEQNHFIRSQIVGKHLPREAYQVFFPIGMNKTYQGSHFVCAHLSPDIDTMIASFFGWLDAFAARIGTEVHIWSLPGGAPESPITTLFCDVFGREILSILAKTELSVEDKSTAGTVSLRDLSNTHEVKLAPHLNVISVIDHHKCHLKTATPFTALIADVQSSNTLVAEQTFLMNDRVSTFGLSSNQIDTAIKNLHETTSSSQIRLLRRLLLLKHNVGNQSPYFVHPAREMIEYFFFLHAILEDSDLLSNVTPRDVDCVAELLNRIMSLSHLDVRDVIHLDDIPKDKNFAKNAAARLLQHKDLYAIYKHIYEARELKVEEEIIRCAAGKENHFFLDTKVQNGCARVGQTKLFSSNFSQFLKVRDKLYDSFVHESKKAHLKQEAVDLSIQMINTITNAEEVYHNHIGPYTHQDELWFWIPETEMAYSHLASFLSGFYQAILPFKNHVSVVLNVQDSAALKDLFVKNLPGISISFEKGSRPSFACLRYKPGAVSSRKAMISPYLPTVISK